MKNALIVTSVASMVDQFLLPSIYLLQNMGYVVHVACNFENGNTCNEEKIKSLKDALAQKNIAFFQVDFARDISNVKQNGKAYKQIQDLMKKKHYSLIHCHSPIGGFLTRLVAQKYRKQGTRVFYTAHGFHFYKGAPIKNWLLYYPVERLCSYMTDVLITINQEDYALAQKRMKAKRIEYVPGVGIDLSRFENICIDRNAKRKEIGIPGDSILLFSVGELNANKNHQIVVRAMAQINNQNICYAIAGVGGKRKDLLELAAEHGLADRMYLLGFRKDIAELNQMADIFCFPSVREGLSVSLMEAMASGLPVVCSKIRGNVDLVDDFDGGMLFSHNSIEECKQAIESMLQSDRTTIGMNNKKKAQQYSIDSIVSMMKTIYSRE